MKKKIYFSNNFANHQMILCPTGWKALLSILCHMVFGMWCLQDGPTRLMHSLFQNVGTHLMTTWHHIQQDCKVNLFLSLYQVLPEVLLAETILSYMTCHGSTQWHSMSNVMYILDHNSLWYKDRNLCTEQQVSEEYPQICTSQHLFLGLTPLFSTSLL